MDMLEPVLVKSVTCNYSEVYGNQSRDIGSVCEAPKSIAVTPISSIARGSASSGTATEVGSAGNATEQNAAANLCVEVLENVIKLTPVCSWIRILASVCNLQ